MRRFVAVWGIPGLIVALLAGHSARAQDAKDPKSKAVHAMLEQKITMQFPPGTPLDDVLRYIKAASAGPTDGGIPIFVDPEGLKKAGATMESKVSIVAKDVALKTSLRQLLEPLGLTYVVEDGLLKITARSIDDRSKETAPRP